MMARKSEAHKKRQPSFCDSRAKIDRLPLPAITGDNDGGPETSMEVEIRACTSMEEIRQAITPIGYYFGQSAPTNEDRFARLTRVLPAERVYGAWQEGCAVGGLAAFPLQLTVPGGGVAAAGITAAGVLPTHRRQGVLRAMMRAMLNACLERGEPVAYLWATEDKIYGRFGFGLASFSAEIDLPREHSAFDAPFAASGHVRLVPPAAADEQIASVYERVASATPGMFARSTAWWQARILADPEWRRGAAGDLQCAVFETGGQPAAYALYRINPAFEQGLQTGSVTVLEALGETSEAATAIWRFLLDIDWMARVRASLLPLDHPLLLLLAEPRRLGFSLRDGVRVRLVDVKAALSARSYQGQGTVTIEIIDKFCPWNAGRWRIGADGVERTVEDPDLRCDITALGSVYLGGFTWMQLARALRVREVCSGAIARADVLFRTDTLPWCPEIF
jgi:predicted acetyltransferase